MTESVYLEGGIFSGMDEYVPASAEIEDASLSKGSLSFRRTRYLNDIWHEKVISHNLRVALVDNIAKHYINRGVALTELIKEGNLGLAHALENFELEGGSRFSTYATRCIRQNLERAIMSQNNHLFIAAPKIVPSMASNISFETAA